METICTWRHEGREDSFVFADGEPAKVLIYRAGNAPSDEDIALLDVRIYTDAGFNAAWMRAKLALKNYDKLMPNMQAAYDFLNARLG